MNIDPIIEAVRQAAALCREVQHRSFSSMTKVNQQYSEPVTIADYGSQAIICRALQQYFPDDAVIAEEAGSQFLAMLNDEQHATVLQLLNTVLDVPVTTDHVVSWLDFGKGVEASRTWVIDPIDGTKGFIAMRHYAIAVGILEDGEPVGGLMAAPGYGDGVSGYDEDGALFYVRDGKAYREPLAGGEAEQIAPSQRTDPATLQIVQSFEREHTSKERMLRVFREAGLGEATITDMDSMEKYALIACGDADVLMRLSRLNSTRRHNIWDHAAGVALVQAAGGRATDLDGSPLRFNEGAIMPNDGMIVTSGGAFHDDLIAATQALLAEEAASS
ncbi:hypothetical protein G4Y79_23205 [Phototrophicus methaneseepsis]|uniref:inositol-phosphate phosphatase n=1 Tax=Phototrophicus methaneseepsis TaxID=2710758 RepID=A0A7S8IDG3_9CHLR|nr:inositol monophosphatase family protein [Phototrophicus methaneseepsis]QPC82560.1 hypothetical protein G4Y79_23205 [Phototrophicus methaneseepsis]